MPMIFSTVFEFRLQVSHFRAQTSKIVQNANLSNIRQIEDNTILIWRIFYWFFCAEIQVKRDLMIGFQPL